MHRSHWVTWMGHLGSFVAWFIMLWPAPFVSAPIYRSTPPLPCGDDIAYPTDLDHLPYTETPWDGYLAELPDLLDDPPVIQTEEANSADGSGTYEEIDWEVVLGEEIHPDDIPEEVNEFPDETNLWEALLEEREEDEDVLPLDEVVPYDIDWLEDEYSAEVPKPLTKTRIPLTLIPPPYLALSPSKKLESTPPKEITPAPEPLPTAEDEESLSVLRELAELPELAGFEEELLDIEDAEYRYRLIEFGRVLKKYVEADRFYIPGTGWLYKDWRKRRARFLAPYLALKLAKRQPDFLELTETKQLQLIRGLVKELNQTLRVSGISVTMLTIYGLAGALGTIVNRVTTDVPVLPALLASFVTVVTGAATVFYVRRHVLTGIQRMMSSKVQHQSSGELDGEITELLTQVRECFQKFQEEEAIVHAAPIMAHLLIQIGHRRRIDPIELMGAFRRLFVEQHIQSEHTYSTFLNATLREIIRSGDRSQSTHYYQEMLEVLLHPPLRNAQAFPVHRALQKLTNKPTESSAGKQ